MLTLAEGCLAGQDLLTLKDLSSHDILQVLSLAKRLDSSTPESCLSGQTVALLFTKPSTRTRVSFEVAVRQLGGHSLFLPATELQLSRGEPIEDTARVLAGYVQGIVMRTHAHHDLETVATLAGVPVINALTELYHPCQVLADLYTLQAHYPDLQKLKIAFFGEIHNVAQSWIVAAAKLGLNLWLAHPPSLGTKAAVLKDLDLGNITFTQDPQLAATAADVLITDTWFSMGDAEDPAKLDLLAPYQVNNALCQLAAPDHTFLHCLPAHRGQEVTTEVLEGPHSLVFAEAAARLPVQKAVLSLTLGGHPA